MSKNKFNSGKKMTEKKEDQKTDKMTDLQQEEVKATEENQLADNVAEENSLQNEVETLKTQYNELNNSYLRLMAEFDNYRKRTLKEKSELIKNGGESALTHLLPVIDDFDRALQNMNTSEDMDAVKQGIDLIYNKFMTYLSHQDVKPIDTLDKPFDPETSEAIAMIPAPDAEKKGKVLDCVQKGYTLHDKVIRHAKVVVGE